ncbi:MAG TPA: ATP-dependent endonuclease [Firmicutes bacterium]|nr:ATP-dependent endonuclease [Bacillota bacterium]
MFLSGLQLVNFRNFKSSCFIFSEGANTVIGENDSGKSNAITCLRMLLDDSFYYNTKRLKESDFSYAINNWKGHWIIISATFSNITSTEKESDICASLIVDDEENIASVSSLISNDNRDHGIVTLFVRPQRGIRKKLFDASGDKATFNEIRNSIRLIDYEFYFTSKSKADFCHDDVYKSIVGDIDLCEATNPENDDTSILGHRITIADVQSHISLVYIDALRDVLREMHVPRNPIRRIIETIESKIDPAHITTVKDKIKELNDAITSIGEIGVIGRGLNQKLLDILGVVYSPEISLSSELSDEINSLSRFIAMKPKNEDDLDLLGLGHLNMIYLALKIVEFEACRSRELLNIMVIEEPEAHIHAHIQKTLFNNLSVTQNYTQVLMTTHSVHLAESSEISRMNILKTLNQNSIAMQPMRQLDQYGKDNLKKKSLSLINCIERYLDAKRNVLLFSKGILLVEGDAEEILIPNMTKAAYGISLDEIGVGLVNVGSTAFEYVASLFDKSRIQRYCAILSDLDKQAVDSSSVYYKSNAEEKGQERKEKLDRLYSNNSWVDMFYADHTFEIEFLKCDNNFEYVSAAIEKIFTQKAAITRHQENIKDKNSQNEEMLSLSKEEGKGWLATIISGELNYNVRIPEYIVKALAFASQETMSLQIYAKMLNYSLGLYNEEKDKHYLKLLHASKDNMSLSKAINGILEDTYFEDDVIVEFINTVFGK